MTARTRIKRDLIPPASFTGKRRKKEVDGSPAGTTFTDSTDCQIDPSSRTSTMDKVGKVHKMDKGKGRAGSGTRSGPRTGVNGDDIPGSTKKHNSGSFEVVVLGSGGGPLETDVSGYLLKPLDRTWEDGFIALEGGSGIGALTDLVDRHGHTSLFPSIEFPTSHRTALLKAAYVFSFLSCYLLTHTHLDHCQSLILLSGSMPRRPRPPKGQRIPSLTLTSQSSPPRAISATTVLNSKGKLTTAPTAKDEPPLKPPIKVYGTRGTLQKLSLAYGGELWPEIVEWDTNPKMFDSARRKSSGSQAGSSHHGDAPSAEMILSPLPSDSTALHLDPDLPLIVRQFEISHGCTSKGSYDSTALFIRSTLSVDSNTSKGTRSNGDIASSEIVSDVGREMLFFGDVESSYRAPGSEDVDVKGRDRAQRCNSRVWTEAARVWSEGRLAGIFIECSYDSERPSELMFGHMSPPGVMHELGTMASEVASLRASDHTGPPLSGLKIYITHIKQYLVPHPSGLTANERIMAQLRALEADRKTGVEFVEVKRGTRIVL